MPLHGPWMHPAPKLLDVDYASTGAQYLRTGVGVGVNPDFGTGDYPTEAETSHPAGVGLLSLGADNRTTATRTAAGGGDPDHVSWLMTQTKWDVGLIQVLSSMSFGYPDLPPAPPTAVGVEFEQPDGSADASSPPATTGWLTDLFLRVKGDVNRREIVSVSGVDYEVFTASTDSVFEFRLESVDQTLTAAQRSEWLIGADLPSKPLLLSVAFPTTMGAAYSPGSGDPEPIDPNVVTWDVPIPLGIIPPTGARAINVTAQFTDQQDHSPPSPPSSHGPAGDYLRHGSKVMFDAYAHVVGAYQPPRFRWLLDVTVVPVRQLQRGDTLAGGAPRQLQTPAASVRQGPGRIR